MKSTSNDLIDRAIGSLKSIVYRLKQKTFWISIVCGQFLSLLVCGTAIFSELILTRTKIEIPIAQSMFVFVTLLIIFSPIYLLNKTKRLSMEQYVLDYMWKYILIAFVEVQANFVAVKAYQYTSPVSVQILDCIAIPTSLLLSMFLLKYRFNLIHLASVVAAIAGTAVIFASEDPNGPKPKSPTFGNGLAVIAGILYGVSNVFQEFLVQQRPVSEYLFSLGLFGTCMTLIQSTPYEISAFQQISELNNQSEFVGYLIGFIAVLVIFYIFLPNFLSKKIFTAVGLNISLQTSDIYTFLISIALFKYKFNVYYQIAWLIIIASSICFHIRPHRERSSSIVVVLA